MSNRSPIAHAATLGRATAFSLIALLAVGGQRPAEARFLPVSGGTLTGVVAANPGAGTPVPSGTWVQSPADLVNKLHDAGYPVARRTVTKYRKMLHIPSSRQRKDWTAVEAGK